MAIIFTPLAAALFVFVFALIVFINNPYRIYFAEKAINKAIKEQHKQERAQKKLERQKEKQEHGQQQKTRKKVENANKVLPLKSAVTENGNDEKKVHDQKPSQHQ